MVICFGNIWYMFFYGLYGCIMALWSEYGIHLVPCCVHVILVYSYLLVYYTATLFTYIMVFYSSEMFTIWCFKIACEFMHLHDSF